MKKRILTQRDTEKWKRLLGEERSRLREQLRTVERGLLKQSQRDASGDLSGYSLHMADVGTDSFEREVSLSHATAEQKLIFEIDEALKRLEEGVFGVCQKCDKPIRKDRLKAVPYARLCVPCKSREEGRRSGDNRTS